ncbi:Flp family type IVb pilin [Azotobacter chroococcum]|uniref:Flp family type IVb pilin n=1 Tax=Azotobacter chroococcum TaxID=353 RepID=A0AA44C6X7_9GAMM|nr:Flp family type IVb pilin [Azotobacter chroococcum]ASL26147.1 hypothetical protein ACG10_07345 [Azotobacter chroococcum]NHN78005.1 Flp family type IVb pilin [Azotobacter chroococcum]
MNLQAIKSSVMKFIKDEEGLTMVEYAVAGSLITLAAAAAFTNLGTAITDAINDMIARMG